MNLKLDVNFQNLLPLAKKLQPYVFGLALVAVFGYTAWVVNGALNVKASTTPVAVDANNPSIAKLRFDKTAIETVRSLDVVGSSVPVGDLGKGDPFK